MMKSSSLRMTAAVAVAAVAGVASSAHAAPSQQSFVANGWRITFPSGIALTNVSGGTLTLDLVKDVTFNSNDGALITFTQVSSDASSQIVIDSETVHNNTGTDWSAFDFLLADPLGPSHGGVFHSASSSFSEIAPFTHMDFSSQQIELNGGTLASGASTHFGGGAIGGSLVIDATRTLGGFPSNFTLKEIPVQGQAPAVPLPAAIWTSLTMLGGLGIISTAKRVRAMLA